MPETLHLAPFDMAQHELILSRAPNGGYVIQRAGGAGIMPVVIGAFSNPTDMMVALSSALLPGVEVTYG